ncbi:sigma factor-like helix-turn-helix DNA-binding protein [Anaerotignum sp.]
MQSTAQIARELGMTERAVEGKLYRLKKKLRNLLGGDTV